MRTFFFALVLCMTFQASISFYVTWSNWVNSQWTPNWSYNSNWSGPSCPSGFVRNTMSSSHPDYHIVRKHYLYVFNNNNLSGYYCGPQSYLRSDYTCERHPKYWDYSQTSYLCDPSFYENGAYIPCTSGNCCYEEGTNQFLFDSESEASSYPSGN